MFPTRFGGVGAAWLSMPDARHDHFFFALTHILLFHLSGLPQHGTTPALQRSVPVKRTLLGVW